MASEITLNNFHPQAYLIYLLSGAPKTLKESRTTPGTSVTGVHKLQGPYRPEAVMSKIYNARDSTGKKLIKAHFFNLETHKISALVPELRFFKAQNVANDVNARLTPFFFPVSATQDRSPQTEEYNLTSATKRTKDTRVRGSGIKSFNVSFTGTNPFTAPRYLEADLSLYVDNLANLFEVRDGYAPLVDLFTISVPRAAKKKEANGSTVTPGDLIRPVEVAATLGYSVPDARLFTQEEIKEIRDSNISLRMNVIHHNINVNQDGSATIAIKYTARINNAARDRIFSATDSPMDLLKRANIRQMFSPEKKKIDSTKKKQTAAEEPKSVRKSQIQKAKQIRKLMDILERNKKIYFIDTDESTLQSYTEIGVESKQRAQDALATFGSSLPGPLHSLAEGLLFQPGAETLTKMLEDLDSSKRRVYYVTFGDLMEAFFEKTKEGLEEAIETLKKSERVKSYIDVRSEEGNTLALTLGVTQDELSDLATISKKSLDEKKKIAKVLNGAKKQLSNYRILLPDIEFKSYVQPDNSEETTRINIADIPIAIETYQEFMYDKIINSYRNTYTIPQFVNDCVNTLLPNVFGRNWSSVGIASKVVSAQPTFTSATYSGPRMRTALASQTSMRPEKVPSGQKDFRATKIEDENEYFVIYQQVDRELTPDRSGNLDKDSRDGIYHFILGKNRGLIKEINFERFDIKYAQEQLMTNQVGLYDELKLPYKSTITMVGNNLFMPGSQIYINPNNIGFGSSLDTNSPAFKIGLGGYYTVHEVSTAFDGNGSLSTKLLCSFGSHASNTEGLSNAAPKPPPLDRIGPASTPSNDDEPLFVQGLVPASEIKFGPPENGDYAELVNLKESDSDSPLLTGDQALELSSHFYEYERDSLSPDPIIFGANVQSYEHNAAGTGIRYNFNNGQVIEIDSSRPAGRRVRIISSTKFIKRSTNGEE